MSLANRNGPAPNEAASTTHQCHKFTSERTRCTRCNRPLHSAVSLARGLGWRCARQMSEVRHAS
ncbi:DUF6011 domain-containing protein [Mycolicibacterium sp. J2]|uniref:DUF6011 domain-containing protein n=1 Tax=Mycolicibacterium sp. J2 TaxID=2993511 RepID=UPI003A4DDDA5